jgi:hypothetical protein
LKPVLGVAIRLVATSNPFYVCPEGIAIDGMTPSSLAMRREDGIVARQSYPQVPPKVEYRLTDWGQSLCPALDAILRWGERRPR